jgi:hypothetical protein
MTVKLLIILCVIFVVVVGLLVKFTYIKPKNKTRPHDVHYTPKSKEKPYIHRPGGVHYISRKKFLENKNKK